MVQIDFANELSGEANFKLVNNKGQVLLNDKVSASQNNLRIDVSKLKAGIYWLIFTSDNQSAARKIVIAR